MKGNTTRALQVGLGLVALLSLGWVLTGRAAAPGGSRLAAQGVPSDWSHRHIIFSQPANEEQAARIAADPRYWQQWYRDSMVRSFPEGVPMSTQRSDVMFSPFSPFSPRLPLPSPASVQHDWSKNLGSGGSVGAGNFPAKYSFSITTIRCGNVANPDFVVFPTGLLGSGAQASIVAYDNLWTACGGTAPKVFWAYNTGGTINTSPVLSQDGTQIAFTQTIGPEDTFLTLLKWKASNTETVTSPGVPTTAANAGAYATCAAPCLFTIRLKGGDGSFSDDSISSVFYDYTGDTAWVGDSRGWLHKFHPVFLSAPAELRSAPWPVQLNPGNPAALASPAHDLSSGRVFVGDAGGFFYWVNTTTAPGQVTKSAQVDHGVGEADLPIVDVTAQLVYVFSSSDGTTNCAGATPCVAVYEFPSNFAANATGTKVVVGSAGTSLTPSPLFDGGFDSTYRASVNATGNIYVCGNTGVAPTLYQIPVSGGVLGTPLAGPVLASAATGCSPITDVFNPKAVGGPVPNVPTELLYVSTQNNANGNLCLAGGCIMNFVSTPWKPANTYAVRQEVLDTHFHIQAVRIGGTSGVATPAWNTTVGGTTTDGAVTWVNQGTYPAHGSWAASTAFSAGTQIIDSNGNIQMVQTAGTSGAGTHPGWNQTPGGVTRDGSIIWEELGAVATFSAAEKGGTSGIIMDSTVAGHADVYFSTQTNQACSDGTGGCAVQASQSGLN